MMEIMIVSSNETASKHLICTYSILGLEYFGESNLVSLDSYVVSFNNSNCKSAARLVSDTLQDQSKNIGILLFL